MLTQETIKTYYHYDPITGDLYRKDQVKSNITYTIKNEYVSFKGKLYSTARIIYVYMMGDDLPKVVMRVDRNPANNKWDNFTTPVQVSVNPITGKTNIRPSTQKRPKKITKAELMQMFRYDAENDAVYFIYNGANKLVTKPIITLGGVRYKRAYLMRRIKQVAMGWDSMFNG